LLLLLVLFVGAFSRVLLEEENEEEDEEDNDDDDDDGDDEDAANGDVDKAGDDGKVGGKGLSAHSTVRRLPALVAVLTKGVAEGGIVEGRFFEKRAEMFHTHTWPSVDTEPSR
jgi:hypothetical protein